MTWSTCEEYEHGYIYLEKYFFFTKIACRQRTCNHDRIMISAYQKGKSTLTTVLYCTSSKTR